MFSPTFLSILSLASLAAAQNDPLQNFCRLFGHQTTVVDRKHYIDGGFVNWGPSPLSKDAINYTSSWLRIGDLDDDNEGFPRQHLGPKNETVPTVHGGILWPDEANKIVYQYGGEYGDEKPEEFSLWSYDIVYGTWNVSSADTRNVQRAAWGAGAVAQDRARGYYYGGWLTRSSVPGFSGNTTLNTMLVYDMLGNSFRNQSGPDGVGRAEGVMVYVPAGDAGMLVYFGGIQDSGNGTMEALPMTDILIYDIGNDKWQRQNASGDEIPGNRRRFCAGAAWAQDRSSYNIYLYGGASVGPGVGYGDVWVLSLPSFQWIKFWPREAAEQGDTFPHHSLSCDVLNGNQMIIMGGHFTNSSDCDVPVIQGQHGLDLGKANAQGVKWARYNASLTTYNVPTEIISSIGGGPTGGATKTAPEGGFANRDLQVAMTRAYTVTSRTPTRAIPTATGGSGDDGGSNKGAIIGGAVGGGLGGLLLVAGVGFFLFLHRRKRNQKAAEAAKKEHRVSELPSHQDPKSPAMSQHTQHTGFPSPGTTHPGSPTQQNGGWGQHGPPAPAYPGSPEQNYAGALPQKHPYGPGYAYSQPNEAGYHAFGHPPGPGPQMEPQEMPDSSLGIMAELPSESSSAPRKN